MRFSKLLEPLQALRDPTQLGVKTVHRIPQTPGSLGQVGLRCLDHTVKLLGAQGRVVR